MPMSRERYEREMAVFGPSPVERRYAAQFSGDATLPLMFWSGTPAELEALLEQAMARGRPVTIEDMLEFQGIEPPPADAVWF
jgi:hypothetical protein